MWVNEREEEELMFDWGDKNIDSYIPRKQENYSVSITSTLRPCLLFVICKSFTGLQVEVSNKKTHLGLEFMFALYTQM